MMAHGMMSINVRGDDPRSVYLKGHDWISGHLGEVTLEITIDDLIAMTQSMKPFAQSLIQCISQIFNDLRLEPINVDPRTLLEIKPRSI